MALAETAELAVKLTLGGNFIREMGKVNRSLKGFDRDSSRAFKAGQQIGTGLKRGAYIAAGAVGVLATQVAAGLDSLVKLEQQTAQTNAVIKSTGGVAGVTATDVRKLAEQYEALNATVGDEVIQSGENLILTYTNIRKEAFEPTLKAALDMNTALGKGPEGLTATVRILGKALNDPTKGLSALTRVGITFSAEQTRRIKGLQKEGKLYEAQNIILAELNKRFGGSFLAQGNTTAGKVAKFSDAIEDLQRSLATALLPTVSNVADALSELLRDPEVIKGVEDLGRDIGNLFSKENIKAGAQFLKDTFNALKSAAGPIKAALGTIGSVLKGAFDAFRSLPEPIQQLLIGGFAVNKLTGGLVTNIAGGIFGALKAMTVQAGVVYVNGGIGGGGLPGGLPGGVAAGAAGISGTAAGALVVAPIIAGAVLGELSRQAFATPQHNAIIASREAARAGGARQGFGSGGSNRGIVPVKITNTASLLTNPKDERANEKLRAAQEKTYTAVETMRGNIAKELQSSKASTDRKLTTVDGSVDQVERAAAETKREAAKGLALVNSTTRVSGSAIVAAIYANRPILQNNISISATSVTKTSTVIRRYGSTAGSRDGGGGNIREGAD